MRPKKWIIGVVVLVALGAGAAAWFWPRSRGAETLHLPGTVEIQEVRLGSRVNGRVAAVPVREGQIVSPGTVLFTLDPAEYAAKRDQAKHKLDSAKAALDKANAGPLPEEIAEAKGAMEMAKARLDRAKAGYRDEQKRQAKSDLETAQADLEKAEADYERLTRLNPQAVSKSELDAVTGARDSARGRVKSAKAMLDMMNTGSRKEDIDEAEGDYNRAAAHFQFLRRGTRDEDKAAAYAAVKEADAALAEAEVNFRETTVTAPERCVIEVVSVRPGDLVPAGQPVIRALRADDLWVKVFAPATELGKLWLGQAVEVTVDSHPGRRFPGQIFYIASISEFTPRNVQSIDERKHQVFAVKVRVTDADGVFKSGMAAEVFIPVEGQ
jgi:multidrug resistance efflux pump